MRNIAKLYWQVTQHFFFNRSEEHTSELQSQFHLVCRLLLVKKKPNEEHGQWNEGQDHQSRDPSISAQTALALIRGRPRLGRVWLNLRVGLLAGAANGCRNQGRSCEGWPPRRGRIFSAQRLEEALRQGGNILMRRL